MTLSMLLKTASQLMLTASWDIFLFVEACVKKVISAHTTAGEDNSLCCIKMELNNRRLCHQNKIASLNMYAPPYSTPQSHSIS
jgi:hypothetical protein